MAAKVSAATRVLFSLPTLFFIGAAVCAGGAKLLQSSADISLTIPIANRTVRARFSFRTDDARAISDAHGTTPEGMNTQAVHRHQETDTVGNPAQGRASDTNLSAQQSLYNTTGGLYSQADIDINGSALPYTKFHGLQARHDLHPRRGERICPITRTKADTRFPWRIGGQTYLFCCPACIDEFVTQAKTIPASLRPPGDYIQK